MWMNDNCVVTDTALLWFCGLVANKATCDRYILKEANNCESIVNVNLMLRIR